MATSREATAKRLLKCFCGCSYLTEEEVQRIYYLSIKGTLLDPQAAKLLRKYFETQRVGDKSVAEQMLDIHEKCEELKEKDHPLLTEDEVEELSELGLEYQLEKRLAKAVRKKDKSKINEWLDRIQDKSRDEIKASTEFKNYQEAILNKLNNRQ